MKVALRGLVAVSALTFLSGCASLSGFDASSDFSCKAPSGVSCKSISGVYKNAKAKNLPSQKAYQKEQAESDGFTLMQSKQVTGQAIQSGTPLFKRAETLRVWFVPWEDDNEVLHDQKFSYLLLQKAKWEVEHFKEAKYRKGFSFNQ